jgi:hypothetical protein
MAEQKGNPDRMRPEQQDRDLNQERGGSTRRDIERDSEQSTQKNPQRKNG